MPYSGTVICCNQLNLLSELSIYHGYFPPKNSQNPSPGWLFDRVLVHGTWLSIKMASYQYWNSRYNDKTILRNHGHGPEVALGANVRCSGFRLADGSVFQHKLHCLKKFSARFDLTRKKPGLLTQHFICSLLSAIYYMFFWSTFYRYHWRVARSIIMIKYDSYISTWYKTVCSASPTPPLSPLP